MEAARWYGWGTYYRADMQEKLRLEYEQFNERYGRNHRYILKLTCRHCRQTFYCKNYLARYCSLDCKRGAYLAARKARRKAQRQKVCLVCGKPFEAKRKDAVYCGGGCKQSKYREALRLNVSPLVRKQETVTV